MFLGNIKNEQAVRRPKEQQTSIKDVRKNNPFSPLSVRAQHNFQKILRFLR